jgi:large subunit ribosomal protein L22e
VIDCTQPVDDKVLDVALFEKYFHDRIKIEGKTDPLAGGSNVVISHDRTQLTIASPAELGFSKNIDELCPDSGSLLIRSAQRLNR